MAVIYQTFSVDLNPLHDVLFEVDGKSRNEDELTKCFYMLPEDIRLDAFHWGMGDTVVRDAAYVFFLNI